MIVDVSVFAWLALRLGRSSVAPIRDAYASEHGARTAHKTAVLFCVCYALIALQFVAFDIDMVVKR